MLSRKRAQYSLAVIITIFVSNILLTTSRVSWVEIMTNHTPMTLSISHPTSQTNNLSKVPRIIYMLWDNGWAKAPFLPRYSLRSFRRHNPDFLIKAMNLLEAEALISRKEHYSDFAWRRASIQAKSDIIRVELLARYGGVWADASVYCNEPLLNWLNDTLLSAHFLAFERKDKGVSNNTSPWIASWFLVATTESDMMRTWRDHVRKAWAQRPLPPYQLGYFWIHRMFRNLVISNSMFGAMYHTMPVLSADPAHCLGVKDVVPPMYKLKASSCSKIRADIFAKEAKMLRNQTGT